MTDVKHYAYRVVWSAEDDEYVATVAEFPSLSWLDADQAKALGGLVDLVSGIVADLESAGDAGEGTKGITERAEEAGELAPADPPAGEPLPWLLALSTVLEEMRDEER